MVARTALKMLDPMPRNTVLNVQTIWVGSSCAEITYAQARQISIDVPTIRVVNSNLL